MSPAHARLQAAYAANNIPWDHQLNLLTMDRADENAAHWERRAFEAQREEEKLTDIRLPIRTAGSDDPQAWVDRQYHGFGYHQPE